MNRPLLPPLNVALMKSINDGWTPPVQQLQIPCFGPALWASHFCYWWVITDHACVNWTAEPKNIFSSAKPTVVCGSNPTLRQNLLAPAGKFSFSPVFLHTGPKYLHAQTGPIPVHECMESQIIRSPVKLGVQCFAQWNFSSAQGMNWNLCSYQSILVWNWLSSSSTDWALAALV